MTHTFVAVLMGSDSDLPTMQSTLDTLGALGIVWAVKILLPIGRRTPRGNVMQAEPRGCKVFICAAGLAAHLAGAVAAPTLRPVIGVPIEGGPLPGMDDALLSTVMMPGGIPVASVAIGRAGAKNAAYLAAQILAGADDTLHQRLIDERAANAEQIQQKDAALQAKLKH